VPGVDGRYKTGDATSPSMGSFDENIHVFINPCSIPPIHPRHSAYYVPLWCCPRSKEKAKAQQQTVPSSCEALLLIWLLLVSIEFIAKSGN